MATITGVCVVIVLYFFVRVALARDLQPIDLEIVSPTFPGRETPVSRLHLDPAWITGMAVLRERWPQFRVTHRFLMTNSSSCVDERDSVSFLLSQWYYRQRRNDSIPVILAPGKELFLEWPWNATNTNLEGQPSAFFWGIVQLVGNGRLSNLSWKKRFSYSYWYCDIWTTFWPLK